jgi:transposase-like protein
VTDIGKTERVIKAGYGVVVAPVGYRFPREVIAVAVGWHLRCGLSSRDVESCWPSAASRSIT